MKFSGIVLSAFLAILQVKLCSAQTSADALPACGLLCIEEMTLKSTCDLTNTTCICTNAQLNQAITECVATNCTIRESLSTFLALSHPAAHILIITAAATEKYSKDACGAKPRDRTRAVSGVGVTFCALGLIVFGLRVVSKLNTPGSTLGVDDMVMGFVAVELVLFGGLSVALSKNGLGLDMWNVSFGKIETFLYLFFWDELIYLSALPLTKISILLFYLRIFPRRSFKYSVYALIAANILYLISFEVVSIWQCRPIKGAWKRWDGEFKCTCNNINLQGWLSAVFNIVLDIAMLSLPMPELYKLSMSTKKKVHIMLMFGVGFFVVIISILRLKALIQFASTMNVTQDYVDLGIWSTIEVPVGVICASMPSIRPLLRNIFPKLFSTTKNDSAGMQNNSSVFSNRQKPKLVSSKPNNSDDRSFIPLVELEFSDNTGKV
ncbi:related to integral membrane protein PTH11 [Phialocephala subalpina]|uniref:Related to integral membrane protein PTH11 n=1 Tax=Phialocephala subalpina TaxID=576137 RepID=A0A1L7XUU0_9HELO|nr:related to integral membrane protein PTH11 [Phialocephala subalpina]